MWYTYYFVTVEHESDCDSYDGEVEDISVDKSGSDTSTSEAEIWLRFRHFCWHTSYIVGGSEKFKSATQHKKSKQSSE
jgi:hypothetical protein